MAGIAVFMWGGTTVAAWTSGYTFGMAALCSAGVIAAAGVLVLVVMAAVLWAADGR